MPSQASGQAPKPSKNVARKAKKGKATKIVEKVGKVIDSLNPFD